MSRRIRRANFDTLASRIADLRANGGGSGTAGTDVTIGTGNGLSITGSSQVLSLALATAVSNGAMSAADFAKLSAIAGTNTGNVTLGLNSNGLQLLGQQLELALATLTSAGALSAFDKSALESTAFVPVEAGTGDDKQAIIDAIAYATANGYSRVHIGDGIWTIDCGGLSDDSALISVPSGMQITGNGEGRSILYVTNTTTAAGVNGCAVFRTVAGATKCLFRGLHFRGTNGTDDATFTFVSNNQNECISIHWSGTSRDIRLEDNFFEQLWGFPCHDRSDSNQRVTLVGNTYVNCANGPNLCSSFSVQALNILYRTEGFEVSGQGALICLNAIQSAYGIGITIGGNQSGTLMPGSMVIGNSILGVTSGPGITVTDGIVGGLVALNYIHKADSGGIVAHGAVAPPVSCVFLGNILDSCCKDPGANLVGLNLQDGPGKHVVYANMAIDRAQAGFSQKYGLNISVPDCVVDANILNGVTVDALLNNGATNTRFGTANYCVNGTEQWVGTASRAALRTTGVAATDIVEFYRVWNLSTLSARSYFALQANGKHLFGDNLNLHDLSFERTSAGVLGVTGSLTVSGSATASGGATVTRSASGDHVVKVTNTHVSGFSTTAYYDETGILKTIVGYDNSNDNAYLQASGANRLILVTDATARVVVGATGNVLIGTETDAGTGRLQVNGAAAVSGNLYVDGGLLNYDASNDYVSLGNPTPGFTSITTNAGKNSSAMLHVVNNDSATRQGIWMDTYSGGASAPTQAAFTSRSARGTYAAPTALATDDLLGGIFGRGYHSGAAFTASSRASMAMRAAEAWTTTNQGSYVTISTTAKGATAATERLRVEDDGTLLHSGGERYSQRSTTATTVTHAATDQTILASASSGAVTINLLAAATAGTGRRLTVVKTDATANAITLDASGAETINGAATLVLAAQYDRATIECTGATWYRVA